MSNQQQLFNYLLSQADNQLILGQRLSEWCGHGPTIEQDIALTNISLDLIGQARLWLDYAAQLDEKGRNEDQLAFMRDAWQFRNVLLVEQPNRDFAYTIVRQFFVDVFNYLNCTALLDSTDEQVAAIAAKSIKEVNYHLRFSSNWMKRLGDGTATSHDKMQEAVDYLWKYTGEFFQMTDDEQHLAQAGIGVDVSKLQSKWMQKVEKVLQEATLSHPENTYMQTGGKAGIHSEHLGHILAEMQFLQRAYPGLEW